MRIPLLDLTEHIDNWKERFSCHPPRSGRRPGIMGENVRSFEEEVAQLPRHHAIAVANGTDALF